MGLRLRQTLWQRQLRKWFMNPVSGVLALVVVVLVAAAALVSEESRQMRGSPMTVVFSPK
jgi:hypothetical protein